MSKIVLTFWMSKITKKITKLLQNNQKVCYNVHTIINRKG